MSTAPKPSLHIRAASLGPVAKLDAPLSKYARNLVYARNGTGKSFLTRALRYLDLHAQGQDIAEAAFHLVSEESQNGLGSFSLTQGQATLGSLSLNSVSPAVSASLGDRLFHVFSDEFVHTELRQREFEVDGNIESKITLDRANINTGDAETKIENATKALSRARLSLQDKIEKAKLEKLSKKAGINKQLKDYQRISFENLVSSHIDQPNLPLRSFNEILTDLDSLKALPADPDYPIDIDAPAPPGELEITRQLLEKITSPSTISEEIKSRISEDPHFYEAGIDILERKGDETCPFCEQSIAHPPAKDTIELYLSYFADAEGKHKKALREAWVKFKGYRAEITRCAASVTRQAAKFEKLKKLLPSQKGVLLPDVTAILDSIDKVLGEYQIAIEAKGKKPFSDVTLPTPRLPEIYSDLAARLNEINAVFKKLRDAILASDGERKNLHREACRSFEIELVHSNWAMVEAVHALSKQRVDAESELAELKKSELSESAKERVANTFELLVKNFFGDKYSFNKKEFVLKRDNRDMVRGPSRTLSDGEKTAIAFCYFIACIHKKVKSESDYAKIYLVFDDPITSMSYDFVFAIAQTLKNINVSAVGDISINPARINKGYLRPDLIIFTHSSYFYNICVTNKVVEKEAAFFLHKTGEVHQLSKLSKYYIAPFEQHLREVFEVHEGRREPQHTTGNAIRCVLEAVGRFCHPDKCDSLSNYVTYLAGEEGFEIKSVLINNLSHGTYYDETPSPEEIREACAEAVAIVKKYANGQLEVVRSFYPSGPVAVASDIAVA